LAGFSEEVLHFREANMVVQLVDEPLPEVVVDGVPEFWVEGVPELPVEGVPEFAV